MTVGCALAQNVNDGRYYPEVYASKFDDGKWRPDNNGQYRGTPDKFGAGGSGAGSRFGGASSGAFVAPVAAPVIAPVAPAPAPVFVAAANPGFGAGFGTGFGSASPKKSGFGSGSSNGQNVGVKEDTRELNEDGSYFYKVLSDNDIEFSETGRVENLGDSSAMRVKGYYEFVADDGVKYRVDYVADENGFQPVGDHLPTPPPIPQEILESLKSQGLI
ncbi:hypothetical protein RP20_CCG009190 [Aedes albopictus]|nr:hypothetical protein RP20_CCG012483 [Aedes albopictus]KXJ76688.1 hypothetical protein RP20_CCG009190 [Aedes albopictus]